MMDDIKSGLILKRPVTITVIVTPRWKEEVQEQLQKQISQLDQQLNQLDMQGNRAISELQKQSNLIPNAQLTQQIQSIQSQVQQKKNELLQRKNQFIQELQKVQLYELNQEVSQAQMESFCRVEKGDNLVQKMNIQIVMRDGVVEEIRGEI